MPTAEVRQSSACAGRVAAIGSALPPQRLERSHPLQLYVILRRNGFTSPEDLAEAAQRSAAAGDAPGSGVRWIRSYALDDESGEVGTVCIYEADSPEAIRAHAASAVLPVDEVIPVLDTVVVRPDPVAAAA